MTARDATLEDDITSAADYVPCPGLTVVFEQGRAVCRQVSINGTEPVCIGRDKDSAQIVLDDPMMSNAHAWIVHRDGAFHVADAGSRNGTFVGGLPVGREYVRAESRVLRVGHTVAIFEDDVDRFLGKGLLVEDGFVRGPDTRMAIGVCEDAGRKGRPLLVTGESGTGKELAAQAYHRASKRRHGPFIAHNAATIPANVAEATLFGARKGAYTGATGAQRGLFVEADGGTLFLDEIGDLPLEVQPKLLRALETGEIAPLGGQTHKVDVLIVTATNQDLPRAAAAGTFRAELLMRLRHAEVHLPPLNARLEEIPFLIEQALAQKRSDPTEPLGVKAHFVEACMIHDWTGENVRGLFLLVGQAVDAAEAARSPMLIALPKMARTSVRPPSPAHASVPPPMKPPTGPPPPPPVPPASIVAPMLQAAIARNPDMPAALREDPRLHRVTWELTHGRTLGGAAEVMGVAKQTLSGLLKRAGVEWK